MKNLITAAASVFILAVISPPAQATDAPAFSIQRVSVAAGLDYSKSEVSIGKKLADEGELKPSLNVAYNLGNYVSLTGSFARGIKSEVNEYRVGFRLRLYRGGQ